MEEDEPAGTCWFLSGAALMPDDLTDSDESEALSDGTSDKETLEDRADAMREEVRQSHAPPTRYWFKKKLEEVQEEALEDAWFKLNEMAEDLDEEARRLWDGEECEHIMWKLQGVQDAQDAIRDLKEGSQPEADGPTEDQPREADEDGR